MIKTNLPSSVTADTRRSVKVASHPHTHTHTQKSGVTHNKAQTLVWLQSITGSSSLQHDLGVLRSSCLGDFSSHTMTVWVWLLLLFSVKTKRIMWSFTRASRATCCSLWGVISRLWSTDSFIMLHLHLVIWQTTNEDNRSNQNQQKYI